MILKGELMQSKLRFLSLILVMFLVSCSKEKVDPNANLAVGEIGLLNGKAFYKIR